MDQLPRLGKRELICLLLFTCSYVVSVWRGFLFLWVLGMGYVILLWHSLSLPYNYFAHCLLCFTKFRWDKYSFCLSGSTDDVSSTRVYDFYVLIEPRCEKSNRKIMSRNWSNQKANPALKTKTGNKLELFFYKKQMSPPFRNQKKIKT